MEIMLWRNNPWKVGKKVRIKPQAGTDERFYNQVGIIVRVESKRVRIKVEDNKGLFTNKMGYEDGIYWARKSQLEPLYEE